MTHHHAQHLHLTPSALEQLATIFEARPGKKLRIVVMPGGCNGFEYGFKVDAEPLGGDDIVMTFSDKVSLVVDDASLGLINGATLDYEASISGASFVLSNPQATSSCGCGKSFSR